MLQFNFSFEFLIFYIPYLLPYIPSSNLELLVNQFNSAAPENGNHPDKIASSKYDDIDEMHNIEIHHKNKPLSLFHINRYSLSKTFDDLQHLLSCNKKNLT